eukprot:2256172-Rhodomonas_salina.6
MELFKMALRQVSYYCSISDGTDNVLSIKISMQLSTLVAGLGAHPYTTCLCTPRYRLRPATADPVLIGCMLLLGALPRVRKARYFRSRRHLPASASGLSAYALATRCAVLTWRRRTASVSAYALATRCSVLTLRRRRATRRTRGRR